MLYNNISLLVVLCSLYLHFTELNGFGLKYMALGDKISQNAPVKMLVLRKFWMSTYI